MRIKTVLIASILLFLVGALPVAAEGWITLFDGKSLDGWEQKGGVAKYRVEDGAIVGQSVPNTGNSFLCTQEMYGDFVLELEMFGHPNLNSGVQIRSNSLPDYKDGRVHGYQVEVEDEGKDRDWTGGIYDEGRRGWIFPTKDDTEKDAAHREAFSKQGKTTWKNGEWNSIKVEAKGDHIRTWINGELRTDLRDDMTARGFIGLQVHGVGDKKEPMTVKWRNIRLKKLSE
jgi:hypothetical protein